MNKPTKVLTGSLDLDKWLDGGYEKGIVSLFYGPSASGKSNLSMLAACQEARENKKVIFVDTEGSFSIDRINQISGIVSEQVLKNIIILTPTNFQEQKKSFEKLSMEIKSTKNIGLIIVDSITMLYRLEFAEARKKGIEEIQEINTDLVNQVKSLYEIARKKEIPVIITSPVYSGHLSEEDWLAGKQAGVNIVGGDILKYWSKCIIELQNHRGKKTAVIRKHRSLPNKVFNYEIINEGIKKKGGWL